MIKKIAVLLAVLWTALSVQAQENKPKGEHHEQMMKAKVAFFTTQIGLTVEEAQVFWPLYNEFWDELHKIHKDSRKAYKAIVALEELGDYTPEEMNRRLDSYLAHFELEAQVHEKYRKRFEEVLPVSKVVKMYIAEEEFRDEMIRMWKDKEQRRPPR